MDVFTAHTCATSSSGAAETPREETPMSEVIDTPTQASRTTAAWNCSPC